MFESMLRLCTVSAVWGWHNVGSFEQFGLGLFMFEEDFSSPVPPPVMVETNRAANGISSVRCGWSVEVKTPTCFWVEALEFARSHDPFLWPFSAARLRVSVFVFSFRGVCLCF